MTINFALASIVLGTSTLVAAAPSDYAGDPADDCEPDGAPGGYGAPGADYVPSGYPTPEPYPAQAGYPGQTGDLAQSGYPRPGDYQYRAQYPAQYQPYQPYQPARWDGERRRRPVMLASDLRLDGRGRRFIVVGPQAGRFARLELKAQHGRTFIKQVYVQFDDGHEQVVRDIDRTVSQRNGLTLDLDGHRRGIRRIVVYGEGERRGWSVGTLSVFAS